MKGPLEQGHLIANRYQIETWIGAGGMQNVYRARDRFFDRPVALKTPKEDAAIKRFEKSAAMSALVNHANVAKTLDYFIESDRAYLVEELVEGADLSKIVPVFLPYLPPSTSALLFHMLMKGLAASHHAGVVHRDLKPSNIMIVGGYQFLGAKITDFGIATMATGEIGPWAAGEDKGSTSSKTILGAIPYMAPESLVDFKASDKPADIWSIAAIVYELLAGQKPFGSGPASIPRILAGKPPPQPQQIAAPQFKGLGTELYQILLRCFALQATDRPSADELVLECGKLCYAFDNYETGTVSKLHKSFMGFISETQGKDLMYHRQSFYGDATTVVGTRLWFGRHPGQGNDRAFPIVKIVG